MRKPMKIFFTLLLLIAGVSYGQTRQEKKPTTLFGITLGKPFDYQALPQCKAPTAIAELKIGCMEKQSTLLDMN